MAEEAGGVVDPGLRVLVVGIIAAIIHFLKDAFPRRGFEVVVVGRRAERTSLVDLDLVKSQREQTSSGIVLPWIQYGRHCNSKMCLIN